MSLDRNLLTLPTTKPFRTTSPLYSRTWVLVIGAFLLYGLLSLLAYRPIYPVDSTQIPTCACGDPALQTWFLRWIPYALTHGRNPLFTTWTNYPYGVNLAQNTEMPLLGLITAPLTILVSPIASYNLLLWLAFPASATAMFFVLNRWTQSTISALVGGFLYGFSAYVVGQGVGHVMLSFVPLPPLFFYQLHKIVIERRNHPYRDGLLLGTIAVAQFFIESELLATMTLIAVCGLIILVISKITALYRIDVSYVARGLATASIPVLLFVSYPLWFLERGPRHFTGPVNPINNPYHSALLGPILSTPGQHFSPNFLLRYGSQLGYVENGIYIGIPLLVLSLIVVIRFRANPWIKFSAVMALLAFLLSLGPHLTFFTHQTTIPLPFALLARVPLLDNIIPSRLSLYVALFISITVALGLSDAISHYRYPVAVAKRHSRGRIGQIWTLAIVLVLIIFVTISLIPGWPYTAVSANIPSFFTSSLVYRIPLNSTILTYPFPYYPDNQAMMWQAVSSMRFKEVGTYTLNLSTQGTATLAPPVLKPASVQSFLIAQEISAAGGFLSAPPITDQLVTDVRQYVENYQISAVVVDESDPSLKGTSAVEQLFTDAFGQPDAVGGIMIWSEAQWSRAS